MNLRDYQNDVIAAYEREIARGQRRIIMVAPTGSGKTVIAAAIIKKTRPSHRPVLVISHRREITTQTSRKLYAHDIPHGIIQAGFPGRPLEEVQVASIQTLWQRAIRTTLLELPPADLLIIDECHHCPAETYRKIMDAYPDAIVALPQRPVGATAAGSAAYLTR
jgi:superfamily II DNA or RNA helicase